MVVIATIVSKLGYFILFRGLISTNPQELIIVITQLEAQLDHSRI